MAHFLILGKRIKKLKRMNKPKYLRNAGKLWTPEQENKLKKLAKINTPTRVIGLDIGKSENAIRSKAFELDISLRPPNRSPYNRRKK